MAELPAARVLPRDAKDRLAVASAHARRGARRASRIARWLWTCFLGTVAVAYVVYHLIGAIGGTEARRDSYAPLRPIHLEGADQLEVVDRPSPTGHGTIKSLARKRKPPAPASATGEGARGEGALSPARP
jgi:hypothetical protein